MEAIFSKTIRSSLRDDICGIFLVYTNGNGKFVVHVSGLLEKFSESNPRRR